MSGVLIIRRIGPLFCPAMRHGPFPLALGFWSLASTEVVPNTERLVSLISEQFLTITGNVTALADPKLHRYRLASAAAARHAALVTRRYARERRAEEPEDLRLEELDPSFCEAAPQFLQIKNESRNMDEFDFVNDCCEPTKFDSLGNEQCFPEWPSWPVRICCAHHLSQGPSKSSYFAGFWRTLAWSIFESTQSIDEPPIAFESHVKSIMAYHKSGVSLSTELVGNVAPGPLTRFLLKNPEETVMVPHDFQVTKFGNHNSLRGGRPVISPFFQSFTRTFSDTKTSDMIIHFSNPLKSEAPQFQHFLSEGAGQVLHLVRRPSDMILSGYRYHRQDLSAGEEWLKFRNPPDCLSCDHEAWFEIFQLCGFRCSYNELLQNVTARQGLQAEYLRSRWDIVKMLENAQAWQSLDHVLQVPMESFHHDFNGTLRCIARFFFDQKPDQIPEQQFSADLERFLEESQGMSPEVLQSCREALLRGEHCTGPRSEDEKSFQYRATTHVASTVERSHLRAELRRTPGWRHFILLADAAFEALLLSSRTRELFGCPT
ncbi:Uncharacterized protein SCF082_LOCUS9695 [Durusdinium trenchii]|uniref:Sulfotransferase domain-containing protein n=2 Tax=Durusdinium trenchii TaxID=1381693 RepID=A0ABP0J141_9DINO